VLQSSLLAEALDFNVDNFRMMRQVIYSSKGNQ